MTLLLKKLHSNRLLANTCYHFIPQLKKCAVSLLPEFLSGARSSPWTWSSSPVSLSRSRVGGASVLITLPTGGEMTRNLIQENWIRICPERRRPTSSRSAADGVWSSATTERVSPLRPSRRSRNIEGSDVVRRREAAPSHQPRQTDRRAAFSSQLELRKNVNIARKKLVMTHFGTTIAKRLSGSGFINAAIQSFIAKVSRLRFTSRTGPHDQFVSN